MNGTVLITGANGSLALGFAKSFLSLYPNHTLIATVRNPSPEEDPNTAKLVQLVSKYPKANVLIEGLDLSNLANARSFAEKLSARIHAGELPRLIAVICNAASISLGGGQKFTSDGYETTFQISHLSHYLLVLKLLDSMDVRSGRIVMLGSITHYTDKPNPFYSLKTYVPDEIEELVKPGPDLPSLVYDRGFQRYGMAKLANVTFANDLNRRLKKVNGYLHTLCRDRSRLLISSQYRIRNYRMSSHFLWTRVDFLRREVKQSKSSLLGSSLGLSTS